MTNPLSKAICIHACSSDLIFLNPVKNRLSKIIGKKIKICDLDDEASHSAALMEIERLDCGLITIFSHGGSDYLRGGEYLRRSTGEIIEIERFLLRADLAKLKGKSVFCMSCDSNGLAQAGLEAGVEAFVGFDKVPFNRFNEQGDPIGSKVLVKHCQNLLADSVKAALERFILGRMTLDETVDYLRFRITKNAINYVRANKTVKERRDVAALLLQTKDGLKFHGSKGVRFKI